MRKPILLPVHRRETYRSIGEEFELAGIINEIFRAAEDGRDFEIKADPETARFINDYFGREFAHTEGGAEDE